MLVYIIDGFNLVHKVPALKNSLNPHTELINYIKKHKFTGSRNNKVIIVFDGSLNYQAQREREFEIVFSLNKTADEIIKKKIDSIKNRTQVKVVSDDREIRDYTKKSGASVVRVKDFIAGKKINRKDKTTDNDKHISYALQKEITDEMRRVWGL